MPKDYFYSIPVMTMLVNDKTREATIAELKRAKAGRVFLCVGTMRDETLPMYIESLKENIPFFRGAGYEVGVWVNSCGHGGALVNDDPDSMTTDEYTLIRDVDGRVQPGNYCVADPDFIADMARRTAEIAKTGPDLIMLDDDLRLDVRAIGVCCACDRHMDILKRLTGREFTREELKKELADPMPNPTRDAFLKANRDSMVGFAAKLREAVNEAAPGVRLGYCAAPLSFDQEGYSAEELTYSFAGDTKPFLRLSAAPYWASREVKRLPETIEKSRQQAAWLRHEGHKDIELFAEGDCYPRPRLNCPASYLECFDQAILADPNIDGILKYMVDYAMSIRYEHGYIDRHVKDSALREAIAREFRSRKSVGVYNFVTHRITAGQHRPYDGDAISWRENASTRFLLAQSLPITYEFTRTAIDTSPVLVSVFGEDARFIGADVLFSSSGRSGTFIIDASAAMILSQRGIDVGFVSVEKAPVPTSEVSADSGERVSIYGNGGDFYRFRLKDGAKALTYYESEYPGSYVYVNGRGARFIVYAFDASRALSADRGLLYFNYERQRLLSRAINEGDVKLPAYVPESLNLYLRASEGDDGSLAVGMWNLWPDTVYAPEVILGERYGSIEFIAGEGILDGDTVRLKSDIVPFGFAGFVVKK